MKVKVSLDLDRNQLLFPRMHNASADLSSPVEGLFYYNTTAKKLKFYDGTSWQTVGDSTGFVGSVGGTEPIYITGTGTSPIVNIRAASGTTAGSMSIAHYNLVNGATSTNTVSTLVQRDSNGDFAARYITATKVTGLAAPVAGTDAVNKNYVDGIAAGLRDFKESCVCTTTTNINLAAPPSTFDGITLSAVYDVGVRILVKDQTNTVQNGIYIWNGTGSAMTRAEDADTTAELGPGAFVMVEEGTLYGDTGWVMKSDDHPSDFALGTSNCLWIQFSGASDYTAGDGLSAVGHQFNVNVDSRAAGTKTTAIVADEVRIDSAWVGHVALTTLGTVTTGTWNGTAVGAVYGGTGQSTYTTGDLLYSDASNSLAKRAIGSTGQALVVTAGVPTWGAVSLASGSAGITGTLAIGNGGTGATSFSGNRVVLSNSGGTALTTAAAMTNGQLLIGSTSAAPALATLAVGANASVTVTNGAGTITLDAIQDIRTSATPTFTRLNLSATTNQIVLQSGGITGTLTWTPATSNKTITLPNLTGTAMLIDGGQTVTSGVWQGTLIGVQYGGTGANLSATGGTGQYVKQSSAGAAFTVGTIAAADLPGTFSGFGTPGANNVTISAPAAGSATTALRSDATFQLSQAITPSWTGKHAYVFGTSTTGFAAADEALEIRTTTAATNNTTHAPSPWISLQANIWTGANTAKEFQIQNQGVSGQNTQYQLVIRSTESANLFLLRENGNLTILGTVNGVTMSSGNVGSGGAGATWDGVTIGVTRGGTGATTFTSGNVLVGAGTSAVTATKAAPSGAFVGTTDTQTLDNKTLTNPRVVDGFYTTGGNQILKFSPGAGVVDYFEMITMPSSGGLKLNALGASTNIDVTVTPKGTGVFGWADAQGTLRAARVYTLTLTTGALDRGGNAIAMGTSISVTHNLNIADPIVRVVNTSTGEQEIVDVAYTSANVVTISFSTAPTTGAYRISIIG